MSRIRWLFPFILSYPIALVLSLGIGWLFAFTYGLAELNRRYEDFLAQEARGSLPLAQATFLYLSILKDDPQLPFELLPDWWAGERANARFAKMRG